MCIQCPVCHNKYVYKRKRIKSCNKKQRATHRTIIGKNKKYKCMECGYEFNTMETDNGSLNMY